MTRVPALLAVPALLLAAPLAARDTLGVFDNWAAFRDPRIHRCYAIARTQGDKAVGYVTVGTWPKRGVRGQVYLRLSRALPARANISVGIGGKRFALTGNGVNAWAKDRAMDAAMVAALRSAQSMSVRARDSAGRSFTDRYALPGAASAIDAATLACARR